MKAALPAVVAGLVLSHFARDAENDAVVPAHAAATQEARAAVQRSLPYIEKTSKAWMVEKKCNSCHVVSFDGWSRRSDFQGYVVMRRENKKELTERQGQISRDMDAMRPPPDREPRLMAPVP